MLKKLLSLGVVLVSAALASCGGGGAGTISGSGGGAAATAAIVTVLASSPQLQSDQGGANKVAITAQVKDASNAVLTGVTVQFGASSGSLAVTQAVTDGSGIAYAQLSNGTNAQNRAITVTATAGQASGGACRALLFAGARSGWPGQPLWRIRPCRAGHPIEVAPGSSR